MYVEPPDRFVRDTGGGSQMTSPFPKFAAIEGGVRTTFADTVKASSRVMR